MSDSSPLAHEGNPKESEPLTVSGGSVHSTATLGVELPFVPAVPGPIVPPPSTSVPIIGTCADVFTWIRTDGNANPLIFTEEPCNESVGWTGSDPPHTIQFDPHLTLTCTPSVSCYGIIQATIAGYDTADPDIVEYYSSFLRLLSGTPNAGPCIIASHDGTPEVVSCIAIIPNFSNNTASVVRFSSASLSDIANATVLYSAAYVPTEQDIFYFQSWQPGSFTATIYSQTLAATRWTSGDLGLTISPNTSTCGFIAIGNSSGQVVYGAGTGTSCSGGSEFRTIRVENDTLP